jgi:flagellar protein FliS
MSLHALTAYNKVNTQTGVENADAHRLIQMLIDGAIEKINRAKYFMKQNKISEKGQQISWAISIISGLQASLNMEQGGELAERLNSLYDFCCHHLVQANIENSVEKLDDVLKVMNNIKEGWDGIREQAIKELKNR